jgi:hypothetical protein
MKTDSFKSVALVAREAAIEVMRRDVKDHGEAGSVRRAIVDAMREHAESDFLGRIGFHLTQGELIAVSMLNGAPFNPRMGGPLPTDAMWLLSPEQESKALELLGQKPPDTRPVFTTPPNPREIPPLLRILPPDMEIVVNECGNRSCGAATAATYIEVLEDIMRRQSKDLYTVEEVAQRLAELRPGKSGSDWAKELRAAHRAGVLPIRSISSGLPLRPKFPADNAMIPNTWTSVQYEEGDSHEHVKWADINNWLRSTAGYGLSMAESADAPTDATWVATTPEPAPDRGQRVKRAALIADNVRRWPTIESEQKDSAKNELSRDAKDGGLLAPDVATWTLKKPQRDDGLAGPIHAVLKAARDKGQSPPTARDVLTAFGDNQPRGILKVLHDQVDYLDSNGEGKSAGLEEIRKRIYRMTR